MPFFENLIKSIPFNNLGETTVVVVIAILIIGFLAYKKIQNKKVVDSKRIDADIKREIELEKLGAALDLDVNLEKNVEIKDSAVGTIASDKASKMKVTVSSGTKIENSEVGKINGR